MTQFSTFLCNDCGDANDYIDAAFTFRGDDRPRCPCGSRDMTRVTREFADAVVNKRDAWVPASGGSETPTRYPDGRTLLYCFNPGTGEHGYLDVETDIMTEPAAA